MKEERWQRRRGTHDYGVDSLGEGMFLSKKMYFTRRTATREMVTT